LVTRIQTPSGLARRGSGPHLVLSLIVEPAVFTAGLEQIEALAAEG
jgi:hypothetical protein